MKTDLTVATFIFYNHEVLLIHHKKLNMWLPVGGHIEKDETPDEAIMREAKEETNLDITLCNIPSLPILGKTITHLAIPFYVNVHNVDSHNHVGLYYVSYAHNPETLCINKEEVLDVSWFTEQQVKDSGIISEEAKLLVELAFHELKKHQ